MLSKILKTAFMPASVLFVLLVAGIILSRLRKGEKTRLYRTGRILLIVTAVLWYVLSLQPTANWLIYTLENDYVVPPAEQLEGITAVVVLSGGVARANELRPDPYPGSAAMYRLIGAVRLFKTSGAEYLYITGGWGGKGRLSEAAVLKTLAMELGVPEDRIRLEEQARSTFEHAPRLREQYPELAGKKFALVTSALHLPRAVAGFERCYRREDIVPYPSGWSYGKQTWGLRTFIPDGPALGESTRACVEYVARVWYWMRPNSNPTSQPIP